MADRILKTLPSNGLFSNKLNLQEKLFLPILVRLDDFRCFRFIFLRVHLLIISLVTIMLKGLPGVEFIFLRRGFAKNEFLLFLSDVDLTIIIDEAKNKKRIENKLKKLCKLFRLLDRRSRVYTREEFISFFDRQVIPKSRWFLYRLCEAKFTWKLLYSNQSYNILDRLVLPCKRVMQLTIIAEILFWHAIIISEFTSYQRLRFKNLNYYQAKRFCWMFMKATTELTNFFNAFLDPNNLIYHRREIIQKILEENSDPRWIDLFKKNEQIINNRFNFKEYGCYLEQAFHYISYLYQSYYEMLELIITRDAGHTGFFENAMASQTNDARNCCGINIDESSSQKFFDDNELAGVFVTPQRVSDKENKFFVNILLNSLRSVPRESINSLLDHLYGQIKTQEIQAAEVSVNLIDYRGFLCFGIPSQYGLKTEWFFKTGSRFSPSLHEIFSDRTLEQLHKEHSREKL
jgi:predicted nucleotidyltransferase